ncbi:hypothetical protein KS4_18160 [Poriferisphaera corsica]|uniref:Phage major capsid protein n=1 Tax=Poriferisphaera corsica TaxID=2528020 RepID=A0A517YU70_9BACT|nr:hypothetical protein [Poriferisphaera corsica]QDU33759.1 hypothetical protein KS4_18160 [Poriferisphaera corsica]
MKTAKEIKEALAANQAKMKELATTDDDNDTTDEIMKLKEIDESLNKELKAAEAAEDVISRKYEEKDNDDKEVERSYKVSDAVEEQLQQVVNSENSAKVQLDYDVVRGFTMGNDSVGSKMQGFQSPDRLRSLPSRVGRIVHPVDTIQAIPAIGGAKMTESGENDSGRPNSTAALGMKEARPVRGKVSYDSTSHALRTIPGLKKAIGQDGLSAAEEYYDTVFVKRLSELPAERKYAVAESTEFDRAEFMKCKAKMSATSGGLILVCNLATQSYLQGIKIDEGSGQFLCNDNGVIAGVQTILCEDMPDYEAVLCDPRTLDFYEFGKLLAVFDGISSPGDEKATYVAHIDVLFLRYNHVLHITNIDGSA